MLDAFRRATKRAIYSLLDILAPDVVAVSDGGGVMQAARAPVVGADKVAHILCRIAPAASLQPAQVNGDPLSIIRIKGEIDTVIAVRIDGGRIAGLYAVRNPQKLSHMERETILRR